MIITKDSIEQYRFHTQKGEDYFWAVYALSKDGILSIQSDYGDYNYRWSAFGECFKSFLIGCHSDYLMGKFAGMRNELDYHKTIDCIVRDIINHVKEIGSVSKEVREIYSTIKTMKKEDYITDGDVLYSELDEIGLIESIYSNAITDVPVVYDYPTQLKQFMKICWPHFINVLKTEIK